MSVMPVALRNHNTIAVSLPPAVMIVPDTSQGKPSWWRPPAAPIHDPFGVYSDNFRFAQQWSKWPQSAVPPVRQQRTVQTVPLTRFVPAQSVKPQLQPFLGAIQAAAQAAPGGEIIFLMGHGGSPQSQNPPSQPQGQLQTSFDLMPEMGGFSAHGLKMTAEVFELWQELKGPVKPILSSPHSLALNDVLTVMQQAGAAMKAAGIRRFIVLSCAVGLGASGPGTGLPDGPRFVQALANLLGVAVVAYQGWVATNDVAGTAPQQLHLWISPTHDPPSGEPAATTDTTRPEFHEVPMDLSVSTLPAGP
jgi:hypothetical protein